MGWTVWEAAAEGGALLAAGPTKAPVVLGGRHRAGRRLLLSLRPRPQ